MSQNTQWMQRDLAVLWHPCTQMKDHERLPLIPIRRGDGVWLEDFDGKRYLDAVSSWWVNVFGHGNARINQRIREQLDSLEHVMLAGFTHAPVVELSSAVLGRDGCLNFFAGPTDKQFSAKMNFYDVHYNSTHVMGTTGGNTADMIESLELTAAKRIDPAVMVTHIGGLNAAAETTLNLPKIPGGKKLIYTHLTMPLIALTDLRAKGEQDNDPRYTALADIVDAHNGLWCPEAEEYLLANFNPED